ncbi:MAG: hypothetical protein Q7J67_06185 [bacterium]|nr:hypothetical protein [bacterium]
MMGYKSAFVESFMGRWFDNYETIIKCVGCKQRIRVPTNKGNLKVTCSKCKYIFCYSPHLLLKKSLGFPLLLIGGALCGLLIAYLNRFYDITGFYLFFIIPVGAIALGLIANTGFVATLAFLRTREINYPMLLLILISGSIALFTFWLSQYIVYSTGTITVNYVSRIAPLELKQGQSKIKQMEDTLHSLHSSIERSSNKLQRIKSTINQTEEKAKSGLTVDQQEHKNLVLQYNSLIPKHNADVKSAQKLDSRYQVSINEVNTLVDKFNRGNIGKEITKVKKEPISKSYTFVDYIKKTYEKRTFRMFGLVGNVPLVTPSAGIEMGQFGLILLLLKQIGLFFALPALWLWASRQ